MATSEMTTDELRFEKSQPTVTREETKGSFLTTEFWAMVGVIAAVLVAAQQADNFDAPRAWTLVSAAASPRAAAPTATETTTAGSTELSGSPCGGLPLTPSACRTVTLSGCSTGRTANRTPRRL